MKRLAVLLLVLAGCATTAIYKVQREPDFQSSTLRRVLIISLSNNPDIRQSVENEFARQWQTRGVEAFPSHKVLPPSTPLEKTHIAPLAKAQAYDTVLAIRLLGASKIDPNIRGQEFDTQASTNTANLSEYFQAVVASPEYSQAYQMAVVSANVYHVATEKRIWSGTTQTLVTKDIQSLIKTYVKVILNKLYEKP